MNRLLLALTLSLLVNLFLTGALAAGLVTLHADKQIISAGSLSVVGTELPKAIGQPFRQTLRATRRSIHPTVLAARQAKAEAAALLRQPVVDQAAVNAALDRARVADVATRAEVEHRVVAFAVALPPLERATLADTMERRGLAKAAD